MLEGIIKYLGESIKVNIFYSVIEMFFLVEIIIKYLFCFRYNVRLDKYK